MFILLFHTRSKKKYKSNHAVNMIRQNIYHIVVTNNIFGIFLRQLFTIVINRIYKALKIYFLLNLKRTIK